MHTRSGAMITRTYTLELGDDMIKVTCGVCSSDLIAREGHTDRTLKCPKCNSPVTVQASLPIPSNVTAPVPTRPPAVAERTAAVATQARPVYRQPASASPPAIGQDVAAQPPQQQTSVRGKRKSKGMASLLGGVAMVTGISAHRFYLGKYGSAILQTFCCWFGLIGSVFLVGIPFLFAWLVWLAIDLFGGIHRMVRIHNEQLT